MNKQLGWLGVLMITIVSGLIVRIVGDPVVELTTPAIEDFLDDVGDRLEESLEDLGDAK